MKHSTLGNDQFESKLGLRTQRNTTLNVLAVDDEPNILELLQSALPELDNCNVAVAGSAAEALAQLKSTESSFDCLLVDIQMPGTTGIELLKQIRNMPGNQETPVIMLTAMNDRKHIEQAFMEGAFDYITKPFDFFELRSRMNAAHLLMMERRKTQYSLSSIKNLREEMDFHQQFRFEDPLSIDGQERCLRYVEFDNYIEQLSRGCRLDSWVTAIKLRDAEYRFELRNFGSFRRAISEVGDCIEKTSATAGGTYSYRGSGVFLIVTHGRDSTEKLPTEGQLNLKLRTALSSRCASANLKTVKSSPVSMRSFSKAGAFTALSNAIKIVNSRETELRQGTVAVAPTFSKPQSSHKEKVKGRLFDTVLRELYGDNSYLARK